MKLMHHPPHFSRSYSVGCDWAFANSFESSCDASKWISNNIGVGNRSYAFSHAHLCFLRKDRTENGSKRKYGLEEGGKMKIFHKIPKDCFVSCCWKDIR